MSEEYITNARKLSDQINLLNDKIGNTVFGLSWSDSIVKDKKLGQYEDTLDSISRTVEGLTNQLENGKKKDDITITAYKNKMDAYYKQLSKSIEQIYKILQSKNLDYGDNPLPDDEELQSFKNIYESFQKSYEVYANQRKEEAREEFDLFMKYTTYDEKEINEYAKDLKEGEHVIADVNDKVMLTFEIKSFPQALAVVHSFRSNKWNSSEYNNLEKSMLNLINHSKKKDYDMKQLVKDMSHVYSCLNLYKSHTNNGYGKVSSLSDQLTRNIKVQAVNKVEEFLETIYYNRINPELREYLKNNGDLSGIKKKEEPLKVSKAGASMSGKTNGKAPENNVVDKEMAGPLLPNM